MDIEELLATDGHLKLADAKLVDWKGVPEEKFSLVQARVFPSLLRGSLKSIWQKANGTSVSHSTSDPYGNVNYNAAPFPQNEKKFLTWEGWYNYFFTELNDNKRKEYYKETLSPDGKVKPPYDDASSMRIVKRKDLLKRMFKEGFIAYTADFHGTGDDLLDPLSDNSSLKSIHVGFRGETRPPAMVKMHNGCMSKALVEGLRNSLGMNRPWHPFTDPELRGKAYFRSGTKNADNCLFTVVSIATDFMTASKFPLMADLNLENPDIIGTATVLVKGLQSRVKAMAAKLGDEIIAQKFGRARRGVYQGSMPKAPEAKGPSQGYERRLLRCVRMNIYLFTVPSLYNTQRFQRSQRATEFKERAALSVPWGNFLARVRCDRIQYDDNDSNAGHLLIVQGYDLLQDHRGIKRAAGGNETGVMQVKKFLHEIRFKGKLRSDGTGGIHCNPGFAPAGIDIQKVEQIDARIGWS